MAWLLLELSEALSSEGRPADVVVGVNQEQMAQLVGLSRASVEKELRALRDRGAISTAYRKTRIVDRSLLVALVPADL
ncbi:helix-turn-helix domain-containing protein [Streptomyces sp. NPDC051572]|uniref:helix-turn-helix domain-containing protein n=1 Tax=Streptomyces sp. NPDC051572 TaxID=3155802 RepID=UPI00344D6012